MDPEFLKDGDFCMYVFQLRAANCGAACPEADTTIPFFTYVDRRDFWASTEAQLKMSWYLVSLLWNIPFALFYIIVWKDFGFIDR